MDFAYDGLKGVSTGPIPNMQPGDYAVAYRTAVEKRVSVLESELRYVRQLLQDANNVQGAMIHFPHSIFKRIDAVLEGSQ